MQTAEAAALYKEMKKDTLIKYVSVNSPAPILGFFTNEHYSTMDLTSLLKSDLSKVKISGIFGDEDGLFDDEARGKIKTLIGKDNFYMVKGSSHNVFIDQQSEFVKAVGKIVRK